MKKSAGKIKSITYSRLNNLGNFENERVEITLAVTKGDGSAELKQAKAWVLDKLKPNTPTYFNRPEHGPVCCCDECM